MRFVLFLVLFVVSSVSVTVSFHFCPSLSLCLSLFRCLLCLSLYPLSLCLSVFMFLSVSVFIDLPLFVFLFLCLSLSRCLWFIIYLSNRWICVVMCICLSVQPHVCASVLSDNSYTMDMFYKLFHFFMVFPL